MIRLSIDPQGRIDGADAFEPTWLGWPADRLLGRMLLDQVSPEDQPALTLAMAAARPDQRALALRVRFIAADGRARTCAVAVRWRAPGGAVRIAAHDVHGLDPQTGVDERAHLAATRLVPPGAPPVGAVDPVPDDPDVARLVAHWTTDLEAHFRRPILSGPAGIPVEDADPAAPDRPASPTFPRLDLAPLPNLDAIGAAPWAWNVQTGAVLRTPAWGRMVGLSEAEVAAAGIDLWYRIAHPDDRAAAAVVVQQHFEGARDFYACDVRLFHHQGHWIWVHDRGSVVTRLPDGRPEWMLGVQLEITPRKNREIALHRDGARLRATLDAMPDLLFEVDQEGRYIDYRTPDPRPRAGVPGDLIGRTLEEVLPPEAAAQIREVMRRVAEGERVTGVEYMLTLPDGQQRWFEASAARREARAPDHPTCLLICRDITHRVQVERQLRYEQKVLDSLFRLSPVGIVLNDAATSRFLDANAAFLATCGYSLEALRQMRVSDLRSPDAAEDHRAQFQLLRETGRYGPFEMDLHHAAGHAFPVLLNGVMAEARDGSHLVWSFVEDISQRRAREQALEWSATHDALTDLPNRRLFQVRLRQALRDAQHNQTQGALLVVDLDGFKEVNDTLGHGAGDELLVQTSARLRQGLREGDTVARFGGDEFLVILTRLQGAPEAQAIAERLGARLARPFPVAGTITRVTASIGIALFRGPDTTAETLLSRADKAMFTAKEQGRHPGGSRVVLHPEGAEPTVPPIPPPP